MGQTPKTLQDVFRERRMKDMKRDYYFYRIRQMWTLVKRLALITGLGYGIHWARKNPETLKSFLKSHTAPVEEIGKNFNEGLKTIKENAYTENDKSLEAYHRQRKKNIESYKKSGIDPVIKYAESGTKEYREELEFYRKEGLFNGRK